MLVIIARRYVPASNADSVPDTGTIGYSADTGTIDQGYGRSVAFGAIFV